MVWVYEVTVLRGRVRKQLLPFPIRIFGQSTIDPKEQTESILTISEAENLLVNLQAAVDEACSV